MRKLLWRTLPYALALASISISVLAQNSTPQLGPVVVVALENHSYNDVVGSSSMPYLNSLIDQNALAQNFFANVHGSFPDYAMVTAGQLVTSSGAGPPAGTVVDIDNIERQLIAAGKSWKVYAEDLPHVGYVGGTVYPYLKFHNPFAYYSDNQNGSPQANNIVPFSQFGGDVSGGSLPDFSFVVPNAVNDARDCPGGGSCPDSLKLSTADQWLQNNIAQLLTSPQFQQNGLLVIWWDEGNATDTANGGGHIAVVLVGPMVKQGFRSTTFYRHQNLLRTLCEALGLGFPGASSSASSMAEFFGKSSSTGTITGQVTNHSNGAALPGATVSYSGGSTKTDSGGNYTLSNVPAGSVNVTAALAGFTSQTSSVNVSSGATSTQNFSLSPASTTPGAITGRVTNASSGAALSGATVSYSGGSAITDSGGNYTLNNVAPGTVMVTASMTGFTSKTASVTVTSGGTSTQNFALAPSSNPAGTITGKVTNSSTAGALAGATVSFSGGSTITDGNGNYTLSNVPAGQVGVTASMSGFTSRTATVNVTAGATSTQNFALAPNGGGAGSISGRVTNISNGIPLSGAIITFSGGSTTSDSNGNYSFSNVAAGTYNFTVTRTGYVHQSQNATVASGAATTLNFGLATGGKVAGTVTDANGAVVPGASTTISGGIVNTTVNATSNSIGQYTSGWVPIGSYTVTVSAPGHTTQSLNTNITTGNTTTLNFTLQ
jgi:phosphatidylinositol-3-phosphatase